MPPTILALLLAAAMLHAGWNFIVKRAGQKLVFTWWAILWGLSLSARCSSLRAALAASRLAVRARQHTLRGGVFLHPDARL